MRGDGIRWARQRKSLRRAVDLPCEVVEGDGFRLLGRRVCDLSEEGAFVLLDPGVRPPRPGTEVFVSLRVPHSRHWVGAVARVSRLVAGRRQSDPGAGIGLRFVEMDRVERAMLRSSLPGLPPPLPTRHLRRDYAATVACWDTGTATVGGTSERAA